MFNFLVVPIYKNFCYSLRHGYILSVGGWVIWSRKVTLEGVPIIGRHKASTQTYFWDVLEFARNPVRSAACVESISRSLQAMGNQHGNVIVPPCGRATLNRCMIIQYWINLRKRCTCAHTHAQNMCTQTTYARKFKPTASARPSFFFVVVHMWMMLIWNYVKRNLAASTVWTADTVCCCFMCLGLGAGCWSGLQRG